jgi:hypothetical protein
MLALLNRSGYALAFGIILVLYAAQVLALLKYPYYSPPSNVEEAAYTYTSASNYNQFGFLATDFLQDFATSTDPNDHPYVYDHMPPGPDITVALLLRTTGDNYALTNILLASLLPIGFIFYLVFLRQILAAHNLSGAGIVVLLSAWLQFPGLISRPISTPFLLLTFGPLVAIARRDGRPGWLLPACLPVVLLSSIYLDYAALSGVVLCWGVLYLTQLLPLSRRTVALVLGTIAVGIGLNLLKNLVYFGPSLFVQELFQMLSNRIIGFPTQQMLHGFYAEHGIVHHGAPPLHMGVVFSVLYANATFASAGTLLLAAGLATATTFELRTRNKEVVTLAIGPSGIADIRYLVSLGLWALGSTVAPVILFPAFAQEVSQLGLTSQIWMTIFAAGLTMTAMSRVTLVFKAFVKVFPRSLWPSVRLSTDTAALSIMWAEVYQWGKCHPGKVAALTAALISSWLLVDGLTFAARTRHGELVAVADIYASNPGRSLEALRDFRDGYFMTNINTPTVYFYVRQPGFGVCGLDSVRENGKIDLEQCKIAFMRNASRYAASAPSYFFFFRQPRYFPGFADCLPSNTIFGQQELASGANCLPQQEDRLRKSYARVFDSDVFSVFDLRQPMKSAAESSGQ